MSASSCLERTSCILVCALCLWSWHKAPLSRAWFHLHCTFPSGWMQHRYFCNSLLLCCMEREMAVIFSSHSFLRYAIARLLLQEHMTSGANCQTFTSSTVISYSNLGDGPKVYQETSEMRSAPGGVRRRPQCVIPAGGCWFCWGRIEFHWRLSVGHPQDFCFAVSCGLRNVSWVTEPCWAPLRGDGKCQLERKSFFLIIMFRSTGTGGKRSMTEVL